MSGKKKTEREVSNDASRTADSAIAGYQAGGPWGAVIGAVAANAGKLYRALGGGGTRDLRPNERAALEQAGYVKVGSNKWRNPTTGEVIKDRGKAIKVARDRLNRPPTTQPTVPTNPNLPYPSVDHRYAVFGAAAPMSREEWLKKLKALKRAKKKPKRFLVGKQLPRAARVMIERAALRFPRVARAMEVGRGNLYLAAAVLGLDYAAGYAIDRYKDWRKGPPLERVKVTAKRMKDPLAGKLSRIKVTARPMYDPFPIGRPRPGPVPRTWPAPGRSPAPRTSPGVLTDIKVSAKRLPDPLAGTLEAIKVSTKRMKVPGTRARIVARAKTVAAYGSLLASSPFWQALPALRSQTKKVGNTAPEPFVSPITNTAPLTYAQPQPVASTAKCKCPKPKKRKSGPRKKRTVCYKGSYVETASGLRKRKREQVPC